MIALEILVLLAIDAMAMVTTLVLALFVGPVRVERRIHGALSRGDFNQDLDAMAKRYVDELAGAAATKVKGLLTGDLQLWSNAEKGVQARQERAVEEAVSTAMASSVEGKGWIKAIGELVSPDLAAWLEKNPKLLTKVLDKLKLAGGALGPAAAGGTPAHLLPEHLRR